MKITQRFGFLLILLLVTTPLLRGQSHYSSPYSRFGLGDLYQMVNATNGAMGGLKYGIRTNFLVNPSNPASYTAFRKHFFVFDAGLNGSTVRMSSGERSRDDGHFTLSPLLFGIPLLDNLSAAFGMAPWSTVGYAISDPQFHPDFGGYNTIYKGDGGLNRVFAGMAYKITENFSAGVNVNYFFGALKYRQTVTFDSINFLNIYSERSRQFSDLALDAGLQYRHYFDKERDISAVAGLFVALPNNLALREDLLVQTFRFSGSGVMIPKDTVHYARGEKGVVKMPLHIGTGLSFQRGDRWLIGTDFSVQDWSQFEALGVSDSLARSLQFAVGGQYKVNNVFLRSGFRYNQTYLEIRENQLTEYGISFGIGIPVFNRAYSISMISTGIEVGRRGTTNEGLIQEQFGRIWFNLTMNQERWFKRREYL
jgi:hypothetical protein